MSKKGFFSILKHLGQAGESRYYEIQQAAQKANIVRSRSQIDVALRLLTKYGLIDRTIHDARPPVTSYRLTKRGKDILHYLGQLEEKLE